MKSEVIPASTPVLLPMSPTGTTTPRQVKRGEHIGLVFTWGAVNAPTGTITINVGNDPTRMTVFAATVSSQPAGTASSSSCQMPNFCWNYWSVTYTKTSGGVGDTLTIDHAAKG
jgi:hypothetical protein